MADTDTPQIEATVPEEQSVTEDAAATEKQEQETETPTNESGDGDGAEQVSQSAASSSEDQSNGDSKTVENGQKTEETAAGDTNNKKEDDDEEDDEDDRKLFVGGLSWETQQNGLKDFMTQFGEVTSCIIKKDNITGRSRGFGFVVFSEVAGLDKALAGRPHKVDGRKIDSKKAQALPKREIKLFVGGVKPETEGTTIREYFSQFGEVVKVDRPKEGGRDGKKFKAFCFVTFKKDSTVAKVIKEKYHTLDDKQVECKEADPPQNSQGGRGRGRGRGGGGSFPPYGYPPGYPFAPGFPPPYGFDMGGGYYSGMDYGMPYGGGYGFGGPQQHSGFGKSRGGRHQNNYKPY